MSFDSSDYAGLTNETAIDPPEPPKCYACGDVPEGRHLFCEDCQTPLCATHAKYLDGVPMCADCIGNSHVEPVMRKTVNEARRELIELTVRFERALNGNRFPPQIQPDPESTVTGAQKLSGSGADGKAAA